MKLAIQLTCIAVVSALAFSSPAVAASIQGSFAVRVSVRDACSIAMDTNDAGPTLRAACTTGARATLAIAATGSVRIEEHGAEESPVHLSSELATSDGAIRSAPGGHLVVVTLTL